MAVSTILQPNKFIRAQLTIPANSTLPIEYTVPGITADTSVIGVSTDHAYVFRGLTATTSTDSVTLSGTQWGTYTDVVTIELIFATTATVTATQVVESGE